MSPKNQLDQVQVPSPCAADWNAMVGNHQVRFCEHCQLSVHNLSAMTRQRALRLVANSRGRLCVRFVHGADGRPITNLPARLHTIGRRVSRYSAAAFTAVLSLSSAAAQSRSETIRTPPGVAQSLPAAQPQPIAAAPFSSSISGKIAAERTKPVTGAIVRLTNKDSGVELLTAADADGIYSFPVVAPGSYTLGVRAAGYADIDGAGITVKKDTSQQRDFWVVRDIPEEEVLVERQVRITGGATSVRVPQHPLVEAAFRDDLAAVRTLLFSGSDANTFDETTQTTALDHAVENGNREMVKLLLGSRARVNGGEKGRNALMSLRENATRDLVLDLIAAGALVNQPDESGDTPLMNAALASNLEAVKTPLKMGARINLANNGGETPLMKAAANDDPDVIKLLLELGADLNAHDEDGQTALLLAASSNKPAMIKSLLDAGARIDVQDKEGTTPLLAAAAGADEEVLRLLIEAGADINAHDQDGQTALMRSASEAPFELVKLLIDKGAELDLRDKAGQTALMRAAIAGDIDSAELLLNAGADFKVRDKDGKTALSLARAGDKTDLTTLLVARGSPE